MTAKLEASNPRDIDDGVTVAGQISSDQVAEIAAAGYKTVVCNRPDHEGEAQPTAEEIGTAVEAAGMRFVYQPVVSGGMTIENVQELAANLSAVEKPIFFYCRSGARSTQLYQTAKEIASR
ncbi:MAG: TIGR01244 family sulfur transferase [Pseudomonadota bacterium]